MEEQPVALATISRSPNSCDSSLMYGVSPQPAQAPENSNSGCRNCVPRTVPKSTRERSATGSVSKNAMLSRSAATSGSRAARLIAVRADETAVAALDAQAGIPFRDQLGDVALLVGRGAARVGAVYRQRADRQVVTVAGHHRRGNGTDELRRAGRHDRRQLPGRCDPAGYFDLVQRLHGAIHSGQVPLDHLGAAAAIGLGDR